jgi:hypothetical protein
MEKTALKIESTTETTEKQKKNYKIPYEKPELIELGSVEHMTAVNSFNVNAF